MGTSTMKHSLGEARSRETRRRAVPWRAPAATLLVLLAAGLGGAGAFVVVGGPRLGFPVGGVQAKGMVTLGAPDSRAAGEHGGGRGDRFGRRRAKVAGLVMLAKQECPSTLSRVSGG
jgi:hypothetical protein